MNSRISFLDLPGEVRNKVYKEYFSNARVAIHLTAGLCHNSVTFKQRLTGSPTFNTPLKPTLPPTKAVSLEREYHLVRVRLLYRERNCASQPLVCHRRTSASPNFTTPVKNMLTVNKQVAAEVDQFFRAQVDFHIANCSCWFSCHCYRYQKPEDLIRFPALRKVLHEGLNSLHSANLNLGTFAVAWRFSEDTDVFFNGNLFRETQEHTARWSGWHDAIEGIRQKWHERDATLNIRIALYDLRGIETWQGSQTRYWIILRCDEFGIVLYRWRQGSDMTGILVNKKHQRLAKKVSSGYEVIEGWIPILNMSSRDSTMIRTAYEDLQTAFVRKFGSGFSPCFPGYTQDHSHELNQFFAQ